MDLQSLLIILVIGAVAGWLAGVLVKGGGFGLLGNIVIGVIGAFIGGFIFGLLGIAAGGILGAIVSATIGAVVGRAPRIQRQPMQTGDVVRTFADLTRSKTELGYEPRISFEEGLRRQWAWMTTHSTQHTAHSS